MPETKTMVPVSLSGAVTVSVMVEIGASELFENENVNWQYCMKHATFSHKEACEFILHIGDKDCYEKSHAERTLEEMRDFGCTVEFIRCYEEAVKMGATRVLFYA
jgi:hypothetical protein